MNHTFLAVSGQGTLEEIVNDTPAMRVQVDLSGHPTVTQLVSAFSGYLRACGYPTCGVVEIESFASSAFSDNVKEEHPVGVITAEPISLTDGIPK